MLICVFGVQNTWASETDYETVRIGNFEIDFNLSTGTIEDCSVEDESGSYELVIPEKISGIEVRHIDGSTFSHCTSLHKIVLPDNLETIGESAFYRSGIKQIVIPQKVTHIGRYAFKECKALTQITVPGSIKSLEEGVFLNCEGLKRVVLSKGITKIGEAAFSGCNSLTAVVLPDGLVSIGDIAFEGCIKLKEVSIPKSVTRIETWAFEGVDGFAIKGYAGTAAQQYAKFNDFKFICIGGGTAKSDLDAKITKNNIQKLLNKYDPDGAFIIKKALAAGSNILTWFSGSDRIIDSIDTAVHEETHGYNAIYAKGKKMAYFVGNKQTVYVAMTNIVPSKKMAASIPKKLRTFRYNTYVGKPQRNLASNVNGAYGLLDEFMAYRTGMHTSISLYPYYVAQNADWDAWTTFLEGGENGKLAYTEFKYYILHYLYYVKKHNAKVYKGIVNNKNFCKAYRIIENRYAKQIQIYEKELRKMKSVLEKQGYRVELTAGRVSVHMGRQGSEYSRVSADYNKLQKEMKKSKYTSIHKKLVKNGK